MACCLPSEVADVTVVTPGVDKVADTRLEGASEGPALIAGG